MPARHDCKAGQWHDTAWDMSSLALGLGQCDVGVQACQVLYGAIGPGRCWEGCQA